MYKFEVRNCPASDLCDCCLGVPSCCCKLKKAVEGAYSENNIKFLQDLDVVIKK